jgi:hypothetical protein
VQSLLCPSETVSPEQLETDRKILAFDKTIQHINRRGFLGAMMASAAAAVALHGQDALAQATPPAITDVLNFALNLEYLEANFYLYVSSGAGLTSAQNGGGPAVQGAPGKLTLDATTLAIAQQLALDEVNHIAGLKAAITALGGTPIAQPLINLSANGAVTTQAQFVSAARQFTALGGSAYVGSAQYLVTNAAVLTTAAQILGAESQHAGALNSLCVQQGITSPAIDPNDIPPSSTNYFTVQPTTALSPARTTSQVLGVAYGSSTAVTQTPSGATMGGFFPSGVNGNIKST